MVTALMQMLDATALFDAVLDDAARFTYDYCVRLLDACGDDLPILNLADYFPSQLGLIVQQPTHLCLARIMPRVEPPRA